jgi:EmrB/QacA subfamily drug resistance transporter
VTDKETPTTSQKSGVRAALVVATLSSFIGPFMSSTVNVALPSIGKEFAMGAVSLGWINTAYLLAAATFMIPFGRMGDLYGKKHIFLYGLVLLLVSSAALALSTSGDMLIVCRVFQGIAGSMIFATAMPILVSIVPPEIRGRSIGIAAGATYVGLSFGPFAGGIITQQFGWRYLFWLNVPLGLLLVAIGYFLLPRDEIRSADVKFDLVGSALLGISLLFTMYGFSTLPSLAAATLTTVGFAGIYLFIRYEARTAEPLLDIGLFRNNPVYTFSSLAALINYAATFAVSFVLSLYLQKLRGLTPRQAGFVLVAQPIMMAIFSPYAGKLSDKIEPRTLASLGMAITSVGLAFMVFLTASTSMTYVVIGLMILGFGFSLFSSPNTNAIMSSVDKRFYGLAGATVSAVRQIGMMVSMGIVMMIMALYLGQADIQIGNFDQFLSSVRITFAVFAIACFGGVFASLARGKMKRE